MYRRKQTSLFNSSAFDKEIEGRREMKTETGYWYKAPKQRARKDVLKYKGKGREGEKNTTTKSTTLAAATTTTQTEKTRVLHAHELLLPAPSEVAPIWAKLSWPADEEAKLAWLRLPPMEP